MSQTTQYRHIVPEQACRFKAADDVWTCENCGIKISAKLSHGIPFVICRKPQAFVRGMVPVQESSGQPWSSVPRVNRTAGGVGTELTKLLGRLGITHKSGCSCGARAASLDLMGPDAAENQIDTIVGWMRDEAKKRNLPFLDAAGRLLVQRAIKNARKREAKSR
jgi:hypothetical protein